jgi:microcystin degradation protein MlrC
MRIAIGSLIHETKPGAPLTMMEAFTLHREQAVLDSLPAFALAGAVLAVELVHRLAARRPVDGVLLALSGGLAIEDEPDGNAELLERVRNVLPPGLPIGVLLEAGALVTERMRQPGVVFGSAAKLLEAMG